MASAMLMVDNNGTVILPQDPVSGGSPLVVNGVTFTAIVTGAPATDIEVSQTIDSSITTIGGTTVRTIQNQQDGPLWFNGGGPNFNAYGSTGWFAGAQYNQSGGFKEPSITTNSMDGSTTFVFYDSPGLSDADPTQTTLSTTTFTTTITQKSTGTVLASRTWTISATTGPAGSNPAGSTSFGPQ